MAGWASRAGVPWVVAHGATAASAVAARMDNGKRLAVMLCLVRSREGRLRLVAEATPMVGLITRVPTGRGVLVMGSIGVLHRRPVVAMAPHGRVMTVVGSRSGRRRRRTPQVSRSRGRRTVNKMV